ncbi:nucleoporin Ndc1 [Bradysia coprophila]|uniref:nucleoporin Ndc1 n=1 Tax=Bradysia coprophila TaxID=38358 RepID=UPI00187DBA90|nr:nucleoporin Ndc1 [Bradysia coprophila]
MSKEQVCRRICNIRFVEAMLYSAALQLLLLTIFLVLMKFSIFHPFSWITDTLSVLLSFRTILWFVPLLAVVLLYGICLGNQYLQKPQYYPTRALWIYQTTLPNCAFFAVHIIFCIVTAWMHSNYSIVSRDNQVNCMPNRNCVHETSLMSIVYGIYVSSYYFFVKGPIDTTYSIIQQNVYMKTRSSLVSLLGKSVLQSIGPLFTYLLLYVVLRGSIKYYIAATFNMDFYDASIFNLTQIFYLWILSAHLLCNMMAITTLFKICVEKYTQFPIVDSPLQTDGSTLTLNDALSSDIACIRKLASYDLFTLANSSDATRRMEIFALSMPGGHPYNWTTLSATCLQQMDSYHDLLSKSIEQIVQDNKTNINMNNRLGRPVPISVTVADKVRFRQYNSNYGIRNMSTTGVYTTDTPATEQINDIMGKIKSRYAALKAYIMNLPGIYYFFGEKFSSKIDFHLHDAETVAWVCQGLSCLAAQSLKEDKYGVVHNSLVKIMTSLLKLRKSADKIFDTRLDIQSSQLKCVHLRNTLGRCLFQLCSTFEEYLTDLITDPNELQQFISITRNPEILSFS